MPRDTLYTTYFARFFSDLIEARERHFTVRSLRMLFEDLCLDCSFDYLKEIKKIGKLQSFLTFWIKNKYKKNCRLFWFLPDISAVDWV